MVAARNINRGYCRLDASVIASYDYQCRALVAAVGDEQRGGLIRALIEYRDRPDLENLQNLRYATAHLIECITEFSRVVEPVAEAMRPEFDQAAASTRPNVLAEMRESVVQLRPYAATLNREIESETSSTDFVPAVLDRLRRFSQQGRYIVNYSWNLKIIRGQSC